MAVANPHAPGDCTWGRACVQHECRAANDPQLGIADTVPNLRALLEHEREKRQALEAQLAGIGRKHADELKAEGDRADAYLSTLNEALVSERDACPRTECGKCWRCVIARGLASRRAGRLTSPPTEVDR